VKLEIFSFSSLSRSSSRRPIAEPKPKSEPCLINLSCLAYNFV
jgi:hypothetical protein